MFQKSESWPQCAHLSNNRSDVVTFISSQCQFWFCTFTECFRQVDVRRLKMIIHKGGVQLWKQSWSVFPWRQNTGCISFPDITNLSVQALFDKWWDDVLSVCRMVLWVWLRYPQLHQHMAVSYRSSSRVTDDACQRFNVSLFSGDLNGELKSGRRKYHGANLSVF